MRKLVLILIAFIAVATFMRAYDNSGLETGAAQVISVSIDNSETGY